jgi:hypothetical protein
MNSLNSRKHFALGDLAGESPTGMFSDISLSTIL